MRVINPENPIESSELDGHVERDLGPGWAFFYLVLAIIGVFVVAMAAVVVVTLLLFGEHAYARDQGQWEKSSPEVRKWFQRLMQPDTITKNEQTGELSGSSCCGEGDAYWVRVAVENDQFDGTIIVAYIEDPRPDQWTLPDGSVVSRIHEDNGTAYVVPPNKIVGQKQRVGNPTGHSLLFLGAKSTGSTGDPASPWIGERSTVRPVLCYVDNSEG